MAPKQARGRSGWVSAKMSSFCLPQGPNLYFCTYDSYDTETIIQIYKTDGTAAGTKPLGAENALTDVPTEAALDGQPAVLQRRTDRLSMEDPWTSAGTKAISVGRAEFLTVLGGKLYFTRGGTLWRSDGSPSGTPAVIGFPGPAPNNLEPLGTSLLFVADDGVHGMELWTYAP